MSMHDPIADMLTRIRNGQQARHVEVSFAASKLKAQICRVLSEEGFIEDSKEWKNKIKDLVILDFLQEKLIQYYKNPTAFEKLNDSK